MIVFSAALQTKGLLSITQKNYSIAQAEFTGTFPATRSPLWLDFSQLGVPMCWGPTGTFLSLCASRSNFWAQLQLDRLDRLDRLDQLDLDQHQPPTLRTPNFHWL